jgi:hypothetical protein
MYFDEPQKGEENYKQKLERAKICSLHTKEKKIINLTNDRFQ